MKKFSHWLPAISSDRIDYLFSQLNQKLWVKPLILCVVSVLAVLLCALADQIPQLQGLPDISRDSLKTLLSIMSSSMLVIAVFAAGSMISAYASASNIATPRSFPLIVADDVSQNALSTFIGSFIFSIIALIALLNEMFEKPARFVLFVLTVLAFAIVILSFVRWVDRIARLGRMHNTIDKIEHAVTKTICLCANDPAFGCHTQTETPTGIAIHADEVGYVQTIDVAALQQLAKRNDITIDVAVHPGTFIFTDTPLAYINQSAANPALEIKPKIARCFAIDKRRNFDEDVRFGLIALSEIASRALSPGVNDPGTAIEISGVLGRVFTRWFEASVEQNESSTKFDRISIPPILLRNMFDDAFNALSRDAAGNLEVGIRLQKTLHALYRLPNTAIQQAACEHARLALQYAEKALQLEHEHKTLRNASSWIPPQ